MIMQFVLKGITIIISMVLPYLLFALPMAIISLIINKKEKEVVEVNQDG